MFEAYKVAVKLTLINEVSSGLVAMAGQFKMLNDRAGEVEQRLLNLKKLALAGGALLGVGAVGLAALKAPLDAARDYELAFTKFKTMNLGEHINKQADQFARSANVLGVSGKDLMTTMTESVGLFGNFDTAKRMAPVIAGLNKANSAIFGGKIDHMDEGSTRSLMKFIDRRGGTHDDATFMRTLDIAQKMMTGSGGFLKFNDLDQFSQQGGTAFRGLSDTGIVNMALLLQEQGGARAGTALMSAYQNMVAGRGTKAAMHEAVSLGLGSMVQDSIGSVGGKNQTRSRFVPNSDFEHMFVQDPTKAMANFILPAIDRMAGGKAPDELVLKVINSLFSNRTASGQQSIMGTQQVQVLRDAKLTAGAMGYKETVGAYAKDPASAYANLHARYADTLRELGIVILPAAIKGVQALSELLTAVKNTAHEFPLLTKSIVGFGAGVSILAGAGGTIMLLKASFSALGMVLGGGGAAGAAGVGLVGVLGKAGLAGAAIFAVVEVGRLAIALSDLFGIKNRKGVELTKDATARSGDLRLAAFDKDFKPFQPLPEGGMKNTGTGRRDFVQPGYKRPYQPQSTDVYMDGHKVSTIVSNRQAREMSRPGTGSRIFDGSVSPRTPGSTGAW